MIKLILIGLVICTTSITFASNTDIEFHSAASSPKTAVPLSLPKFLVRDRGIARIVTLCKQREATVGAQKYPIFDEFHRCHVFGNEAIDIVQTLLAVLGKAITMDETVLTTAYTKAVVLNIMIFGHHLKRSKNKITRAIYEYDTALLNTFINWISPHIQNEAPIAKSYTLLTMLTALRKYPCEQYTEFITPTEMLAFLNSTIDDLYTLQECNGILRIMRLSTH